MVFSSLLFLYAFLPLNLLCYLSAPTLKAKNMVMLVFSLIFYAWAGPVYVLLLVGMAFANFHIARTIDTAQRTRTRRTWLFRGVALDLLLLGVFKYLTFFLQNFHNWFGIPSTVLKIALPIGISFYTFQLISYMVDVYRRQVPAQQHFPTLLLYISLFHQCIAGPIVRYETVAQELTERYIRQWDISEGIRRFTVGLAKKALLANVCAYLADSFLVATDAADAATVLLTRPALSLWLGMIAYTMQIYLDFSAYSDMAIGMGRMIGFHYDENFNYPYTAVSITDFWRRWHISLSSFFRDYLYIPLGGNRCSIPRQLFNLLVVWGLTGFWHGASWNFLFWGIYYFVFLVIEKFVLKNLLPHLPEWGSRVYVLLVVSIGWMLFRFEDMGQLATVLKGLIGLNGNTFTNYETNVTLLSYLLFFIVAAIGCTPFIANARQWLQLRSAVSRPTLRLYNLLLMVLPLLLVVLSTAALVGDSYNPFLYFRF